MSFTRLTRAHPAMISTLRLWLPFLGCAGAAAACIGVLQQADVYLAWPALPTAQATASDRFAASRRPAFAPTFDEAAASLRAGRYPEAYGRFVALADEGDVDAGQIALFMHRLGPELFGSAWDASAEQLAAWTRWSDEAAQLELAGALAKAPRAAGSGRAQGHASSRLTVAGAR